MTPSNNLQKKKKKGDWKGRLLWTELGNLNSYGDLSSMVLSKHFMPSAKYSYLLVCYMEGEGI